MDQPNPGTVTLSLDAYDELNKAYQDQEPMSRQERIDSIAHTTAVCAGIAITFVAATAAYYWIKDKQESRALERQLKAAGEKPIQDIPHQR